MTHLPVPGLNTAGIGSAGELYLQYRLALKGISSARMNVDSGIDLACYPPSGVPFTVQVKTTLQSAPSGGRGELSLAIQFPDNEQSDYLALVNLATEEVWMFPTEDARALAQQHRSDGSRQLAWYMTENPRARVTYPPEKVEPYRLDTWLAQLLDQPAV